MDLGGWLRSLGLEQYEAAFRENAIDDAVLLSLTADDLKDLGIGLVGHRRRLLDAIAVLRAEAGTKTPPTDTLPTIDKSQKDAAERRQVTVLFSDLVGSTALAAHWRLIDSASSGRTEPEFVRARAGHRIHLSARPLFAACLRFCRNRYKLRLLGNITAVRRRTDVEIGSLQRAPQVGTNRFVVNSRAIRSSPALATLALTTRSLCTSQIKSASSSGVPPTNSLNVGARCSPSAAVGVITQGTPAARLSSTLPLMPAPKRSGATVRRT
jgi:SAM domain (Sterile alpha motif)